MLLKNGFFEKKCYNISIRYFDGSSMIDYKIAVKELRDKLIMTQHEFAKFLGVSFGSVNRWENGQNNSTTGAKRKIVEYCAKYNVKLEEK